jgi:DNA ligase-1
LLHKKLYNIDSKGKTRVWYMESEHNRYRTVSGILDGNLVTSEWTTVEGKNIGKANETSPAQQALSEVESQYENKLARKYNDTLETAARSNIFQPMLAATYKADKTKDRNYMWQPKLDGVRCALKPEGGFSREGKPFFTIAHILEDLHPSELIFDGELYNHELKDDFDKLVSMIRQQKVEELSAADLAEIREKVQYHVYDVFDPNEPNRPFRERQKFLKAVLTETDKIKLVLTGEIPNLSTMEDKHGECIELGYEGIMLRVPESPYEHKRSKNLIKHKNFQTEEFEVVDIESGIGNWEGIAKKVVLKLPDGRIFKSGIDGSMEKNRQRLIDKEKFIGGDALCRFQNYTPDGIPRFGVIKFLYAGKRDI